MAPVNGAPANGSPAGAIMPFQGSGAGNPPPASPLPIAIPQPGGGASSEVTPWIQGDPPAGGVVPGRRWHPVLYQAPRASEAYLWGNWHAIRNQNLASNALVTVEGGPAPSHDRNILVNRFYRPLGVRAWLVLCALAAHHVARAGGPTPFDVPYSAFISAHDIVAIISHCLLPEIRREHGLPEFWPWPATDDVHNEIMDLRGSFRRAEVNENVIERNGRGFRFSVPPPNLILVCWQRLPPAFPASGPVNGNGHARGNGNGNGDGSGNGNGNGNGNGVGGGGVPPAA